MTSINSYFMKKNDRMKFYSSISQKVVLKIQDSIEKGRFSMKIYVKHLYREIQEVLRFIWLCEKTLFELNFKFWHSSSVIFMEAQILIQHNFASLTMAKTSRNSSEDANDSCHARTQLNKEASMLENFVE